MIKVKNNKMTQDTWAGQTIEPGAYYIVENSELLRWQQNDKVLSDIASGALIVNDGINDIIGVSNQIDYIKDRQPKEVTTQYEKNDKDLRLARVRINIENGQGEVRLKTPGTFGDENDGRWIAGGDGWLYDFDPDDFLRVDCYDDDRLIAWAVALSQNPEASEPVADEVIQNAGVIPMLGMALPNYPMIKTYTDDDLPYDNQGWYFWPLALGSTLSPVGEIEFEPIAGYGHIYGGLYLVIKIIRPNVQTGTFRGNLFWGKKE